MRSPLKSTILFLTFLAFSSVWVTQPRGVPLPYKSKPLHQIKKIYVVDIGLEFLRLHETSVNRKKEDEMLAFLEKEHMRYQGLAALVEQELHRVGFAVVKDVHDADAELIGVIRPTNNPAEIDQRRHYTYRLMPPTNKFTIDFLDVEHMLWEADFKMSRKITRDESDKNAAVKVADTLLNAWLTSAKKAGLTVGDKVQ